MKSWSPWPPTMTSYHGNQYASSEQEVRCNKAQRSYKSKGIKIVEANEIVEIFKSVNNVIVKSKIPDEISIDLGNIIPIDNPTFYY
ncbi:hypothetical protein M0802_014738 [Mischocyttarus mexicanus]|nr:hypothetical protein M0802_014738 [Mischocyttarus mexicanus]